ncbi:MAG: DUF1517 domain-containing protein [Myxococcaceae bacterium]|nr:DUF1517 domain-containing protein [Myxococcaceae bacterium]
MTRILLLALLFTSAPLVAAQPSKRAKPTKPAKPKPPPPPEAEPEDLPDDDPALDPDALDAPPPPHVPRGMNDSNSDDEEPFKSRSDKQQLEDLGLKEEDLQALGGMMLCGCFCFVAGLIGLVVFLVRRSNKPAAQPGQPQQAWQPPAAAAAPPAPTVHFHLSVLAVGMHATARQLVSQSLLIAGAQADPTDAPERAKLVRELAKAVRGLDSEWVQFGYGERTDLADDAAAQSSYQKAVEDFGRRSAEPSTSGEAAYVVMTLVLCTRRQLRGVSALDDRAQIRTLLDERSTLGDGDLMGAYIAWSQPLGGHEVLARFPEMHAVR